MGIVALRMNVGVCRVTLRIHDNSSLKGKRQVIKPIIAGLKNRFNVSVAEVGSNDSWQTADIGICVVSSDARYTSEVLSKVSAYLDSGRFDAEVINISTEIIHF